MNSASRATDNGSVKPRLMDQWLPIESAPLDVRGLLWCPDLFGELVWSESEGRNVRTAKGVVFGYVSIYMDLPRKAYGEGLNGDWTFTHWMPLPSPPSERDE